MLVKFNAAEEFVDELRKEPLAKPVVRLTFLRKANEKVAPLTIMTGFGMTYYKATLSWFRIIRQKSETSKER